MKPTIFFAISFLRIDSREESLSSSAQEWLPALLEPVSRHRQQRARFTAWRPAPTASPSPGSNLFDMAEVQLQAGRATEDRDRDLDLGLLVIDVLDRAVEVRERAFLDAHQLADHPLHLRPGLVDAL